MSDDKPMTEEDLAAARELDAARTPGRWEWWTSNSFRRLTAEGGRDGGVLCGDIQQHDGQPDVVCKESDTAFIAGCSTLVPRLLRGVERLRADLGHVEPAEEPRRDVVDDIDGCDEIVRCECCGLAVATGEPLAVFWADEGKAHLAVMHWGPCPEPDLWRVEYEVSGSGLIRVHDGDVQPSTLWMRPYEESLVKAQTLLDAVRRFEAGELPRVSCIRLVRVRKEPARD